MYLWHSGKQALTPKISLFILTLYIVSHTPRAFSPCERNHRFSLKNLVIPKMKIYFLLQKVFTHSFDLIEIQNNRLDLTIILAETDLELCRESKMKKKYYWGRYPSFPELPLWKKWVIILQMVVDHSWRWVTIMRTMMSGDYKGEGGLPSLP